MAQQSWRTRRTKQSYRPHYDSEADRTRNDEPRSPAPTSENEVAYQWAGGRMFRVVEKNGERRPQLRWGGENGSYVDMHFEEVIFYCQISDRLIKFLQKHIPSFLAKPQKLTQEEYLEKIRKIKLD